MGILDEDRERVERMGIPFTMKGWDALTKMDAIHNPIHSTRSGADLDDWQLDAADAAATEARRTVRTILEAHIRDGRIFLQGLGDAIARCLEKYDAGVQRETAESIAADATDMISNAYTEDLRATLRQQVWDRLETEALEEESGSLLRYRNQRMSDLTPLYVQRRLAELYGLFDFPDDGGEP